MARNYGPPSERELFEKGEDPYGYRYKATVERRALETDAKARLIGAKTQRAQFSHTLFTSFKPLIVVVLAVILLVGPGLGLIMSLTAGLNMWMWIGLLFLIILIWRNWSK